MKYDDASWHYEGTFPASSPTEYGATHIALFLKWCFQKGWAGEMHLDEHPDEVQKVKEGSLSATEFLIRYCDEQLTDEDLNEEGNTFAEKYYGDDGMYLEDYAEHFGELMYTAPEAAHDYQLFSNLLEKRLKSGKLTK